MTVVIPIEVLRAVAKTRPAGYLDDVISKGELRDGVLYLDRLVYIELRQKYSPHAASTSVTQKAQNAAGAIGRLAKAVFTGSQISSSPEEVQRRLAICHACEFYQNGRCLKCGCYMNLKTRLETEHCPIGKW